MYVRAHPVGYPSWTSYGSLKDILMSSPVDVQFWYPRTSKKRTSLGSVKNLGKIKKLTSAGIEPRDSWMPCQCYASMLHLFLLIWNKGDIGAPLLAHNVHRTFYGYPVNENPSVRLASATDILLMECLDQENGSILGCPMDGHRYQSGMWK